MTLQYLLRPRQVCLNHNKYLLTLQTRRQRKRQTHLEGGYIKLLLTACRYQKQSSLALHYKHCCFIMHEKGDNQLSVAAAVKCCGRIKATLLHILPTYVSRSCTENKLCSSDYLKSRSSLCLTDNLECRDTVYLLIRKITNISLPICLFGKKGDFLITSKFKTC